jgi:Dynamin central region/Dynamin family
MGVPLPSQNSSFTTQSSAFSEDILQIELSGPAKSHLSVMDVPGIFRTPTPGVTSKADIKVVENMVRRFIKDPRTIILAVLPANVDIATQEILELAEEADPQGVRTLGVLTKPDLVEAGTETDIIQLLEGKKKPLKLGYCMVRNRKQQEWDLTSKERHGNEELFFKTGPFNMIARDRAGVHALHQRLQKLLRDITRRAFPLVRRELDKKLEAATKALHDIGPSRTSEYEQRAYLTDLASRYQEAVSCAVAANYSRNDYLQGDRSIRLATRLVDLNEEYATSMAKRGRAVPFKGTSSEESGGEDQEDEEQNEDSPDADCSGDESAEGSADLLSPVTNDDSSKPSQEDSDEDQDLFSELDDLVHAGSEVHSSYRDITEWLTTVYRANRGFELGTFNPSIVSTIFGKFTSNWQPLTELYVVNSIKIVHRFSHEVLEHFSADERVCNALWEALVDDFKQQYRKARDHALFLLNIERNGTMLTTNHYFAQNMERATRSRHEALVKKHQSVHQYQDASRTLRTVSAFDASSYLAASHASNEQLTVKTIHDVLQAYYKVARKRFVDAVCMQVTDFHLISGPAACLKRFDAQYVLRLTPQQLEQIAGEDPSALERRVALEKEIEALKGGKEVLSG